MRSPFPCRISNKMKNLRSRLSLRPPGSSIENAFCDKMCILQSRLLNITVCLHKQRLGIHDPLH